MADVVLDSTKKFGDQFLGDNVDIKEDLLAPHQIVGISHHVSQDKRQISATGSVAFGTEVVFEFPSGYIADCYIVANLGALTSGNYTTYPGITLIDHLFLEHNGKNLHDYDYRPVIHDCMNRMHDEQVVQLLASSGGTAHTSGNVLVPLPLFFTRIAFGMKQSNFTHPLNANQLNGKLKLRIRLRTAALMSDAGATTGSPTISLKMYVVNYYTEDELMRMHKSSKYVYKGPDFSTLQYSTAVTTAVATEIDISSLKGNLKQLKIFDKLVSDIDTAHDHFLNKDTITDIKLKIDGKIYYESNELVALQWDRMSVCEELRSATVLNAAIIPFAISFDQAHFTGALSMNAVNKLICSVTTGLGANGYVDFCARKHCFYEIDKYGNLVRNE